MRFINYVIFLDNLNPTFGKKTMIDPNQKIDLLGQRSPASFMKQYWQRKPLLIRNAIPDFKPPVSFTDLKNLAKQDNVESRLIWQENNTWNMENGPFSRFPKITEPDWTLLVQSMDLHHDALAQLMQQFRFIPDARLDDVMISFAAMGGGVGPHFDSYDVFLLQAQGQRKWRISQQKDLSLVPDLPCKILQNFEAEEEFVLNPGDMLYLPPHVAHDGISLSDKCMTISIGFKTPSFATLALGLLEAAADQINARANLGFGLYSEPVMKGPNLGGMYKDKGQEATDTPAEIPERMIQAALDNIAKISFNKELASRFLGCWLTEPNQLSVFEASETAVYLDVEVPESGTLMLDRKTRMLYFGNEVYINGEALPVRLNPLLKTLANQRSMPAAAIGKANEDTRELMQQWLEDGWLHFRP